MSQYFRTCPKCQNQISYTDRSNYLRAEKKQSACNKCTIKITPESIEKIRRAITGTRHPNRASNSKSGKDLPFKRNCPNCLKDLSYATKYAVNRANKQGAVCNPCSNEIHKKSWNYVIKDEHIQKMAAVKAGYETFDEYMADLDNKKKYRRAVQKVTKQQNISLLENYDKLRGLCGVEGAYQLDHIISIVKGYEEGIAPEVIGDISNLQIIPWKENLLKSA